MRRVPAAFAVGALAAGLTVAVLTSGVGVAVADPVPPPTGAALGFGYNVQGQLGLGTTATATTPTPAQLPEGVSVSQAVAGYVHTVALGSDGNVYAWGDNAYGELGTGTTTASKVPIAVGIPAGVTVTSVAAGYFDSFAVTSTGAVYSWGINNLGQLGNGGSATAKTPTLVSLPSGVSVASLSTGYAHTLIVTGAGVPYAWGYNASGQLGDGTVTTRRTPVAVRVLTGTTVTSSRAGSLHSLAVTSTGDVLGWGSNSNGQVGNGGSANVLTPVVVPLGASASAASVSGGALHSLAVTTTGATYAWGSNASAQYGNGTTTSSPTPVLLAGLAPLYSAAAGNGYSLFLTTSGTVYGSGDNRYGSLGVGTSYPYYSGPTLAKLPAAAPVSALSASINGYHSVAVVPTVVTSAALTSSSNPSPQGQPTALTATIAGPIPATSIAFVSDGAPIPGCDSLALRKVSGTNNYRAYCAVSNLGAGTHSITVDFAGDAYHTASHAVLDQSVTSTAGVLVGWGVNTSGQLGNGGSGAKTLPIAPSLPDDAQAVSVAVDNNHTLVLLANGDLYAFGANASGQLGDGTTTTHRVPVKITLPDGVTPIAVAAGNSTSFLVTSEGALYGWGLNTYGQQGDGTTANVLVPQRVPMPDGVRIVQVTSGLGHTLGLTSTGEVYAWGLNNFGQLGIGSTMNTPTPTAVPLFGGYRVGAVSAGYSHSLALVSDGRVVAWGDNRSGELGNNLPTYAAYPSLTAIPSGTTITSVSASYTASYGLTSSGAVLAWGYNGYGELGDGTMTNSITPVAVGLPAGATATAIAAQYLAGMARTSDGAVYVWGDNQYGEIGDGTTTSSPTPVATKLPVGGKAVAVAGGHGGLTGLAIVPRITSATNVTSTPNPTSYGDIVTITATVTPTDGGKVAFTADGSDTPITDCSAVTLVGSAGTYTATCKTTTLEVGTHPIIAAYAGDRLYKPSSAAVERGQTVDVITSSTTLATSVNPGTYKSPVTFTATVSPVDGTGTVEFTSDGAVITGCGTQALAATSTTRTYTATCITSALDVGNHTIAANYSGSPHYASSTATLDGGETVKYATQTVVENARLLGLNPKPIFKATLTNLPDGTPVVGATIDFSISGQGGNVVCSAVTDSNGFASCQSPTVQVPGQYRGQYAGDATHFDSLGLASIRL